MKPFQASLKKNERSVYKNLLDKGKIMNPEFQINDLVRTADLKKMFSKSDLTNWSFRLYKTKEIINDTIPSYKIDKLPESHKEDSLLKKTEF